MFVFYQDINTESTITIKLYLVISYPRYISFHPIAVLTFTLIITHYTSMSDFSEWNVGIKFIGQITNYV